MSKNKPAKPEGETEEPANPNALAAPVTRAEASDFAAEFAVVREKVLAAAETIIMEFSRSLNRQQQKGGPQALPSAD